MVAAPRRNDLVDRLRGAALVAMFLYHLTWDLALLGFIDTNVPLSPPMKAYAHVVAWTFLLLVGVSLVLATRGGLRRRAFVRRLALIAAAAGAITLATWLLFPDHFIFFGVLHCIAVSSVLALAFVAAPLWLVGAAAIASLAAPLLIAAPLFDAAPLIWLGLGTDVPDTYDYAPLFPGLGVVLCGIVLARIARVAFPQIKRMRALPRPFRLLAWGGRRSLLIYLVHQPIFLGFLYVLAQATGTHARTEHEAFLDACQANCVTSAAAGAFCGRACLCAVTRLEASPLWPKVFAAKISPQQRDGILAIETACVNETPAR